MKKMPFVAAAAVLATVGLLSVSQIQAQRPAAPATSTNGIAVIDLQAVFRNSNRIKQAAEAMNKELQAKKETFRKEGERGNQMVEKARALPSGSPERKKLEQEILKLDADLKLEGKKSDREFRDRESKTTFAVLRETNEELARYAQANGLQLVLGNESPNDLSDPQSMIREMSKLIVYQRTTDITGPLTDALNRRSGAPSTARGPGASTGAPKSAPR